MKKLLLILSCIVVFGCSKNDDRIRCNFLFDAGVNLTVDTNLPQFSQLKYSGNGVYVPNQGNNGIWLWRLNSSILYAWDAADPSHESIACSTLEDSGMGDIVTCGCEDGNQYSLATGNGFSENTLSCTLKPYIVNTDDYSTFYISN